MHLYLCNSFFTAFFHTCLKFLHSTVCFWTDLQVPLMLDRDHTGGSKEFLFHAKAQRVIMKVHPNASWLTCSIRKDISETQYGIDMRLELLIYHRILIFLVLFFFFFNVMQFQIYSLIYIAPFNLFLKIS